MSFDPLWLGIMISMNLQTSFLTPPFGFSLFYLRGVAPPEISTKDIYLGVLPFIGLQIVALLISWIYPQTILWLPKLIFG
jgi:TRAP-type mannitol/chloroaromatic compound transport system permease large subunit